jgi:hypothetical protein
MKSRPRVIVHNHFAARDARLAMPLRGHPYHTKSDDELRYILKDAGEAAEAMRGHSPRAEGKYLDQKNDAATVLYYRSKGGKRLVPGAADSGSARIVHSKLLGGWFVVKGPHQTPISGKFNSKAEAEAWMERVGSKQIENAQKFASRDTWYHDSQVNGYYILRGAVGDDGRWLVRNGRYDIVKTAGSKAEAVSFAKQSKNGGANQQQQQIAADASGDRVKILGGMKEFIGKTGTVSGKEGGMWRVRLDEPVNIPGVGSVTSDLWEGRFLRKIDRAGDARARDARIEVNTEHPKPSDTKKVEALAKKHGAKVVYVTDKSVMLEAPPEFERDVRAIGLGWILN